MKKSVLLLIGGWMLLGPVALAQQQLTHELSEISASYQNNLTKLVNKYSHVTDSVSDNNPFLYQLMSSTTYYNNALHNSFSLDADSTSEAAVMDKTLMASYLNHPSRYQFTQSSLNKVRPTATKATEEAQPKLKVTDLVEVEKPVAEVGDVEPIADKPDFWKYTANLYFQASQSYVSNNWYKGGESANTLLTGMTLEANYDNQQKIIWENKAELKLGFISTASDSLHKYKTNNDLFRLTTKFGYKATKSWYYTALAELENQFFSGYKDNDPTVYSKFLSPMKFNASLGIDWKKKKDNVYEISLALLPASMNMWYIKDSNIAMEQFSFDEGQHFQVKIGHRLQLDHTWNFAKNVKWTSHFYVFTSYHNVESQWENTFDFQVNKVLSAKIFVNARYDDAVTKSALQLNESLSFGLNYTL